MIARLIYFLLGVPPMPDHSKVSAFSDNPPEVIIHERNIFVSLLCLLIATGIVLFVTQTTILQDAHAATDIWFDNAADFMSESQLFEWIIRTVGFLLSLGMFWIVPMSLFLIAVTRSVFEMFPSLKNPQKL